MVCSNPKFGMANNWKRPWDMYFVENRPKILFEFNTSFERKASKAFKNHKLKVIGTTEKQSYGRSKILI